MVPGRPQRLQRPPRRLVVRAVLRATLTSTVLVALYYTLPLTGRLEASTTIMLLTGLVVFTAVITWQVRAILRSDYPGLRAIEALAAAIPLFLLVFAATYFKLADVRPQAFTEPLTRTDALYFTVTVFATVGFGDIAPVVTAARVTVMVQMLGDLLVVGLVLRGMLGAVRASLQRREAAATADSSDREDVGQGPGSYAADQDRARP